METELTLIVINQAIPAELKIAIANYVRPDNAGAAIADEDIEKIEEFSRCAAYGVIFRTCNYIKGENET